MPVRIKGYNANPWGKYLPDCSVRALSLALNYSYSGICRMFKVPFKDGHGLDQDEGMAHVDEIVSVCDKRNFIDNYEVDEIYDGIFHDGSNVLDDAEGGWYDADDSMIDIEMGYTLDEFSEMYPPGRYVVFLRPTRNRRLQGSWSWHSTYLDNSTKTVYDTFDCRKGMFVFGWMKIRDGAVLKNSDRKSRMAELGRIRNGEPAEWRKTAESTIGKDDNPLLMDYLFHRTPSRIS